MLSEYNTLIQLLRSSDVINDGNSEISAHFDGESHPKLPNPNDIELGEIALNIAKGYEVIAIKNDNGEIVYLPFNVAVRLLEAETKISDVEEYAITSINELSASTIQLFESLDDFEQSVEERFREYASIIYELSGNTEDNFNIVFNEIDEISGLTYEISGLTSEIKDSVDVIGGDVDELSAKTESLEDSLSALTSDFIEFSGYTIDSLDALSGSISSYTEIRKEFEEIELVHAGAFKAFKQSTGLDENAQYIPTNEKLNGFNMTEAIDYVADYADSLNEENDHFKDEVKDNELVHAGAFSKINNSLGFDNNAHYNPLSEKLYGYNVTEAIDYINGLCEDLIFYFGTVDPNSRMIQVTYESLDKLIKEKSLRRGFLYRIQNYQATLSDEASVNFTTRIPVIESGSKTSMGFDIIVMAISENVLNENAIAVMSEDEYYFEDCNLSAWKLKYSFKNDKERFSWASENGFGVIYYMEDEYGNSAGYDFKNILNKFDGNTYFTFNGIDSNNNDLDLSILGYATSNRIQPYYDENGMQSINKVSFTCHHLEGERVTCNNVAPNTIEKVFSGDTLCNLIGYTLRNNS